MTITHEFDRDEVMAYLDGELAPARALEVHAHLEKCAECGAIANDLRQISMNLRAWTVEPAPSAVVAPAGAPVKPSVRSAWWRSLPIAPRWIAVGVASVAVLAFVVLAQMQRRPRPAAADGWQATSVATGGGDASDAVKSLGYVSAGNQSRGRPAGAAGRAESGRGGAPTNQSARRDPMQVIQMTPAPMGPILGFSASEQTQAPTAGAPDSQMIVRTATVSLQTEKFEDMRAGLERVAAAHHGSLAALSVAGDPPNQRSLNATMRVPVAELDAALAAVRGLGRVLQESQSSEDVTDAHRNLAIRIANAKVEEARLGEILKDRTGKLSDVLAVEQAQSRVRTEIEQMEAEELAMRNRAALSTITIDVAERYRAELADAGPTPIGLRLRNALVDGARAAIESAIGVTLAILGAAPTLLLWTAVLFLPARLLWRRLRRRPVTAV